MSLKQKKKKTKKPVRFSVSFFLFVFHFKNISSVYMNLLRCFCFLDSCRTAIFVCKSITHALNGK